MKVTKISHTMLAAFLLICFVNTGCKGRVYDKEEVNSYLADSENGLQKTEKVGGIEVKLKYQPRELILARASSPNNKNEDEMNKYQDKSFFILSFSKDGKELLRQLAFSTYSEMVQVFAFRMSSYISLLKKNSEPIAPDDCLFQQTYGASDANHLLLVFNTKDIESTSEFKIRLNEFGLGLGIITFSFNKADISNVPKIEIKNL